MRKFSPKPSRPHTRSDQRRDRASVAVVGTFPPTQCGLATFTHSLASAMRGEGWPVGVVDVVDLVHPNRSPLVRIQWERGDEKTLNESRRLLNTYDTVVLQHEFGIFGGPDGDEVLQLIDGLDSSLIVVLHTVLEHPSANQRRILEAIVARADALVTLTGAARDRLARSMGVDASRVLVIAHGAHAVTTPRWSSPEQPTILTWGLLGPGKGIEHVIDAVARLGEITLPTGRRVRPQYLISGDTHPKVLEQMGDSYRQSLIARAEAAGVADQVTFVQGYKDLASLHRLIAGSDVVVLPYDSREQVTSGVLVEAVAAGLPTVSTAFPHAVELAAAGVGLVVPHEDPGAIARALQLVLCDPQVGDALRRAAEDMSDSLLWPSVGAEFGRVCDRLADSARPGATGSEVAAIVVGR